MGHAGVGWVHYVGSGVGASCRSGVGHAGWLGHVGVGWIM